MDLLKLIALDRDDVQVVSTHLQDAIVKVSDIIWRPREHRLVIALNRFDWEGALGDDPQFRRRRAAIRFERVNGLKCKNVSSSDGNAVLNLLAVDFVETNTPSGILTLLFSGGAALRLEVECLECELADLGPVWKAVACPCHNDVAGEDMKAGAGVDAPLSPRH